MGASGDNRNLPEWVEFEWFDLPEKKNYTKAEMDLFPRQKQRVDVRSRVTQEAVQMAIESRRTSDPKQLPDLMLWIYFVWTDQGIKFAWLLKNDRSQAVRKGGDDIDAIVRGQ